MLVTKATSRVVIGYADPRYILCVETWHMLSFTSEQGSKQTIHVHKRQCLCMQIKAHSQIDYRESVFAKEHKCPASTSVTSSQSAFLALCMLWGLITLV